MVLFAYDPMNRTEPIPRRKKFMNRLKNWPLLCGLLGFAVARTVLWRATLRASLMLTMTSSVIPARKRHPPVIDAINFINNNSFTINFTLADISGAQPFYETWDTLNYTNNGVLMANSGFQFDNQSSSTGLRTMSASFYNPGTVSCGSINDTTDPSVGLFNF